MSEGAECGETRSHARTRGVRLPGVRQPLIISIYLDLRLLLDQRLHITYYTSLT